MTYGESLHRPKFEELFPDDEACTEDLFRQRCPDGFVCPNCEVGNAARLKRKCCVRQYHGYRKQTSVTAFMHCSHVSLRNWYRAFHIITVHSNRMSAL